MERDTYVAIRDLEWTEKRPVVFVHGDVEGMVTACVFLRSRGPETEVRFTGARRLARDLQALADRIAMDLPVSEVLIGNVPVRPAAIGAARQILAAGVPVVWVDHHTTRQNLLEEVSSLDGLNFLHDAELEAPAPTLAARAMEIDLDGLARLLGIDGAGEDADDWLQDRQSLLSAQIGRCQPDILRRIAVEADLTDEDRSTIDGHRARESAADNLVFEQEHQTLEVGGCKLVVVDARGQEVGFLPRRVETRYGDVDLRLIVPDGENVLLTSADRSRDLVRLLRALPWPAGVFVGGRPHHARIDPGTAGMDAVLSILQDPASWPGDVNAAAARPPRGARQGRPQKGRRDDRTWGGADRSPGPVRGFFEQMVEQRVMADLTETVWRAGERMSIYRGDGQHTAGALVLELDGIARRVALICTPSSAAISHVPVPSSMADMPDACVVWVRVDDRDRNRLKLSYRWLGDEPGEPLPRVDEFPEERASQGNYRRVPVGRLSEVRSTRALLDRLFGRP